MISGAGRKVV